MLPKGSNSTVAGLWGSRKEKLSLLAATCTGLVRSWSCDTLCSLLPFLRPGYSLPPAPLGFLPKSALAFQQRP